MLAVSPIGSLGLVNPDGQSQIRGTLTATAGECIFAKRKSLPMRIAIPAPSRRETTLSETARAHPAFGISRNALA